MVQQDEGSTVDVFRRVIADLLRGSIKVVLGGGVEGVRKSRSIGSPKGWRSGFLILAMAVCISPAAAESTAPSPAGTSPKKVKKVRKSNKLDLKVVACPKMNLGEAWSKVDEKDQAQIYRGRDEKGLVIRCEKSPESPQQVIAGWRSESPVTRTGPTSFFFDKKSENALIRVYVHYLTKSSIYVTAALVVKEPEPKVVDSAHSDMLAILRLL